VRLKPIDRHLLRELLRWQGNQPEGALRLPVRDLAKRTGAHPNTVRARLVALGKGGVLEGAYFEPWPRLVGLVHAGWMVSGFRGRETESRLASFPEVANAVVGLDWAFLHVWTTDDAAAQGVAARFAREVGAARLERHFTSSDFPPAPADAIEATPLDLRIALALRAPAGASLAGIARAAGATTRTVERRAKRLFEARAGGMFPRLRPARIEGAIVAHLRLAVGDARGPGSLAAAFPERLAGPWGNGVNAGVAILVENLDEADRAAASVEGRPGVERVEVLLYRDVLYNEAHEPWLAAHVSRRHNPPMRAGISPSRARRAR
jgi:DNA-binding Lrp family transcriptional regulator